MSARTEIELSWVSRAREGSADAWDALLERVQLPIYTYIRELVAEDAVALDLVQETFLAAITSIESLRRPEGFVSWMFGIAHRRVRDHWRKTARYREILDQFDANDVGNWASGGLEPDGEEWPEAIEETLELLKSLEPPFRSILVLRFLEDLSVREIAQVLAIPEGTVRSRLHYAKRALRQRLGSQCL